MDPTEELVRRALGLAEKRDADAFLSCCTEDVEVRTVSSLVDPSDAFLGHDGVRRWAAELRERWTQITTEVRRVFVVEEGAVVDVAATFKGVQSGAAVEWQGAHASRVRDGRVAAFTFHETLDAAAQALGHPTLNVALVARHHAAWRRRDEEATVAMMDPKLDIDYRDVIPDLDRLQGPAGMTTLVRRWFDAFGDEEFAPLEYEAFGDAVLVRYRQNARSRQGGVPVSMEGFQLWAFADHRAVAFRGFVDEAKARALAAHLSASASR